MKKRTFLNTLVSALLFGGLVSSVQAAPDYPSRPVTIIVPFAAGGASDLLARQLGKQLSVKLGQSFVIENRAGAGGTIGARLASRAAPDGYTLVMGTNASHAIAATTHRNLSYDPLKDFDAISLVAHVPQVVVVHPSVPVSNIPELIKYAKSNQAHLNFSSAGIGTPGHLGMELLKMLAGVEMEHVPFQGGNPALIAVTGGQVQLLADNVSSALPQVKAGKVKPIAVTSAHRSKALPDIPTIAEQGVAGFESGSWFALFAPAGTPPEIISKLNTEVALALKDPVSHATLSAQGAEPAPGTPDALRQLIRDDLKKWGDVVKRIGLQVD
ncbi:tripartite tricarboxylate transporter substrate binding protein [Candidimonas sp. SYP-B2681]|uniref:Bug family tripartite tricarboxylate transporter substrate binding protein n=1 Tax=Candidimonas sp. SYP-B2681 TaxID=2497686 RepID=UPI000F86E33E|nr:tripartite tricarboxylate transporter substrate binding protein [Candidimonas sp. SYP-B2681]RTZ44591.1 tripartite tricarboxylate transporter substrate binding protein [Candidimonas sp. SYP-B2681]